MFFESVSLAIFCTCASGVAEFFRDTHVIVVCVFAMSTLLRPNCGQVSFTPGLPSPKDLAGVHSNNLPPRPRETNCGFQGLISGPLSRFCIFERGSQFPRSGTDSINWPRTKKRSACLCLHSSGVKRVHYHAWVFFKSVFYVLLA